MRFTCLNLMPWPHLPDDFRQTTRSVWVDIPSRLYDPKKGHFVYNKYMDQLEYADALGFDGMCQGAPPELLRAHAVAEHHRNIGRTKPHEGGIRPWPLPAICPARLLARCPSVRENRA